MEKIVTIKVTDQQKIDAKDIPDQLLTGLPVEILMAMESGDLDAYLVPKLSCDGLDHDDSVEDKPPRHERRSKAKIAHGRCKPGVDRNHKIRDRLLNTK